MKIFITLNKIAVDNFDIKETTGLIAEKAKKLIVDHPTDNINITLNKSNSQTSAMLGNTLVLVQIFSDYLLKNSGQSLVELKNDLINIFESLGINIDKNNVDIRVFSETKNASIIEAAVQSSNKFKTNNNINDEYNYEAKSKQFLPVEPLYSFDRVILPQETVDKIQEAIGILECENKVFKEWGLYEIQPHPSTALSFFGPSGTGKTMAAEAVAQKLGKKILKVSYADVESKYHGEGPKMVKSIFIAATNADAVLFFDEADSLLSKRLTNVTQGSEQAINSMRSQLLICLEEFRGIVIFATNLVVNYDQAFLTRLISVEFKLPNCETREKIWNVHIKAPNDGKMHQLKIPLSEDVDTKELSYKFKFVGREIRNAVVSACVSAALEQKNLVEQQDFVKACTKIEEEKKALEAAKDYTKNTTNGTEWIKEAIVKKIKSEREVD